jgi:sulfonate transport system ATP-binding protein
LLHAARERGATISLRGVKKSFGAKAVLHGLDLAVPAGQFLAIVGRSGCGKSTLLRLIAGLDTADRGSLQIDDGGAATKAGKAIRLMFQEPRLLPWARLAANVEVGVSPGTAKTEARRQAESALGAVGLAERAQDWPHVLSGGQKQRVALARALVSQPRLLAFDEPLGALDALTRIEMQNLLEKIWLGDGFTAVLVTHDVSEALALADRIVLIEDGAIALDLAVALPRPRRRGSAEFAALEELILNHLLADGGRSPAMTG